GDIDVLVAGDAVDAAANAAATVPGVSNVLRADAAYLAKPTAENLTATTLDALKRAAYTHVVCAATSFGKNVMPRIAAKLDVSQISDITAILSSDTFVRPIYAGNAFATVRSSDPI